MKARIGQYIRAHHPRGGHIEGRIVKRERISGYGPRFVLDNGASIAAADVCAILAGPPRDPREPTAAERLCAMLAYCPVELRADTMRGYIARGLHRAFGSGTILSIDAWRDGSSWTWNNWHAVGRYPFAWLDLKPRALLRTMREAGYLSDASRGRVTVEDDGYNVCVLDRRTREPLFALEYGNHE
jgi:hypothetical protein